MEQQRLERERRWAAMTDVERAAVIAAEDEARRARARSADVAFERQQAIKAALSELQDPTEFRFLAVTSLGSNATQFINERFPDAGHDPLEAARWFAAQAKKRNIPFDTSHEVAYSEKRLLRTTHGTKTLRAWALQNADRSRPDTLVLENGSAHTPGVTAPLSWMLGTDVMWSAVLKLGIKLRVDWPDET